MTEQEWTSLVKKRRPELFGWPWQRYTGWSWEEMSPADKEWIAERTEEQVIAVITASILAKQ